jgi:hypothetical protein
MLRLPRPPLRPSLVALALAAALVPGACRSTEDLPERRPPSARPPWTSTFLRPAMLVAEDVTIEGPDDLTDHVAVLQDPENLVYEVRTTERGLEQTTRVKPQRRAEIRAQLDALQIVALRRLRVLSRPGDVPVRLRANGEVWWRLEDGSDEKRAPSLELVGRRAQ